MRKVGEETRSQRESPIAYEEVVKAIKSMKKGKGVGGDEVSSEMLLKGGRCCGIICTRCCVLG